MVPKLRPARTVRQLLALPLLPPAAASIVSLAIVEGAVTCGRRPAVLVLSVIAVRRSAGRLPALPERPRLR